MQHNPELEKERQQKLLADWVQKKEQAASAHSKKNQSLIVFLALREEIKNAVEAKYPIKTIWQYMTERGKIHFRYETFAKLINQYIKNKPTTELNNLPVTSSKPALTQTPTEQSLTEKSKIPSFVFNPHPNKEDLI